MTTIHVIEPGLLTTVQDGGRHGWRKYGVPAGGAMDTLSMRIANMLVGNDECEGILEVTLVGPRLRFDGAGLIAICGADVAPTLMGTALSMWRPVAIPDQGILEVGSARRGARAYLAVAGGVDVPKILGSRSTLLSAGIGGVQGRAIIAGDQLPVRGVMGIDGMSPAGWFVDGNSLLHLSSDPVAIRVIRVIRGPEFEWCADADRFFSETFTLSPDSNRMGYRLTGPRLERNDRMEMLTEGVAPGTIQLPPDGMPIILMADCQTTGGYPRIASVVSVDLPVVAQLKPGDRIRFTKVSLAEAERLLVERERMLRRIRCGIELRWSRGSTYS